MKPVMDTLTAVRRQIADGGEAGETLSDLDALIALIEGLRRPAEMTATTIMDDWVNFGRGDSKALRATIANHLILSAASTKARQG